MKKQIEAFLNSPAAVDRGEAKARYTPGKWEYDWTAGGATLAEGNSPHTFASIEFNPALSQEAQAGLKFPRICPNEAHLKNLPSRQQGRAHVLHPCPPCQFH